MMTDIYSNDGPRSDQDRLREAIRRSRLVYQHNEDVDRIIAAAESTLPKTKSIECWEVRCVDIVVVPATCMGRLPHVAVRYDGASAELLAEQWRKAEGKSCVEVRKSTHLVSA